MGLQCRIEMLGGLRAIQGERVISRFRTQKFGALLAYLAYHIPRAHPRELLIEMLWPDCDPIVGRQRLSNALSSLRHQIEPPGTSAGAILMADRFSVRLNPASVTTDVAEFEALVGSAARAGSTVERLQFLKDAVDAYHGELLPGYYEEWISPEQQRLSQNFLRAIEEMTTLLEEAGDFNGALECARRAVTVDPLREEAHREVIRLHGLLGQFAAALRQYQELGRLLERELGEEPSAATRAIVEEVRRKATAAPEPEKRIPRADRQVKSANRNIPALTLPTGTVTFLFTDIEGSTARWESEGERFRATLAAHHALMRREFRRHNGHEVNEAGDGFLAAFGRAADALSCAVAVQHALAVEEGEAASLQVRMALHTGDVELQENGEYRGLTLHRAGRIRMAAHGGQIVCSEVTAGLLRRDLEPGVQLRDLGVYRLRDVPLPERLFQVEYPDLKKREFPPLKADSGHSGILPLQLTRFFGREQEIARLIELLTPGPLPSGEGAARRTGGSHRLVTLTGPGGTGKTRLALQAAERLLEAYEGAVWFAPLADVSDARLIGGALLDACQIARLPDKDPLDQFIAATPRRPALLVMDSFEHLVEEGSNVVRTLLQTLLDLRCLVTSRQQLNIQGERKIAVPPLPIPNGSDTPARLGLFESVQLFVDRAQTVRPDFQITTGNAPAVAELCDRLEGIPLAIELAASRAQVLTPGQMLAQLSNRYDFLVSRHRDTEVRHRTLRAAVDWSYKLLAPDLRRFFSAVSVFHGGWTAEAAEAVCREPLTLDYLAMLRECSLILVEEHAGGMRFRMLETLREYAAEQLSSEEKAVRQRWHAEYFLALAEDAETQLHGPDQRNWLDQLEREHDNFRAALTWCEESDRALGLCLAGVLGELWGRRGHLTEGRRWLGRALERSDGTPAAMRARACYELASLAECQSDYAEARALYEQSLALSQEDGDHRAAARALRGIASVGSFFNIWPKDLEIAEESLRMHRELGDVEGTAAALEVLGNVRQWMRASTPYFEESLAIYRQMGDSSGMARALGALGAMEINEEDFVRAVPLLEESLEIHRELGDTRGISSDLIDLGRVYTHQGNYSRAISLCEESLRLLRELGDRSSAAFALVILALAVRDQGDWERARTYFMESLEVSTEIGDRVRAAAAHRSLGLIARLQGDPREEYRRMEQSLAMAREADHHFVIAHALLGLSDASYQQGDPVAARSLREEALARFLGYFASDTFALAYTWVGSVAGSQEDWNTATSLFEKSLAIAREHEDKQKTARALRLAGCAAREQGDTAAARARMEESLEVMRHLEPDNALACLLHDLGWLAHDRGDYETARVYHQESLALFRSFNAAPSIPYSLYALSEATRECGDWHAAFSLLQECLQIAREGRDWRNWHSSMPLLQGTLPMARTTIGPRHQLASVLLSVGDTTRHLGDSAGARPLLEESLRLFQELDNKTGITACLDALARLSGVE